MKFFLGHSRWDVSFFLNGKEPDSYSSNLTSSDVTIKTPWMIYFVLNIVVNLIVFVAFIKFLFSKDLPVKLRGCIGSIVLYIAIATGPSAAARFRLPVFPILTVTFVVVVHRMTRKLPESAEFAD
jgi:formate/nitrite transporter FocA (FNT family)